MLDVRMPERDGLSVLQAITERGIPCRTLLLTAAITDQQVLEAVRFGAAGLVFKEAPAEALLDSLRKVYRGETCIDADVVAQAVESSRGQQRQRQDVDRLLTPREIEIVRLLAQGHRNNSIAERLNISEGTVKVHLHNVYEKLGLSSRLELVLFAQDHGIVET